MSMECGDVRCAVLTHGDGRPDLSEYGVETARRVRVFHKTFKEYAPTPLVRLDGLAHRLGLGQLYVKDESKRFGLNAFKVLGGSYAVGKLTAERPGQKLTFVTATDGNHGRGVAWAATRLGHRAVVYMPKGSAPERLENIEAAGATAYITDMVYDDAVRYALRMADECGWLLTQDTAWPGYEDVPRTIMQGYTTMALEMAEQLKSTRPTHLLLQAGVGSMAAAVAAFFSEWYGPERPRIIVVEPTGADCLYRTAAAGDGQLHACPGEMKSIMAGLCCGEPCTLAWDVLRQVGDFFIACPDSVSADGMRILGAPFDGDERIISGESGAVTTGLTARLMTDPSCRPLREELGLGPDSVVLCVSTEGATDRENYRDIVWRGKYSSI